MALLLRHRHHLAQLRQSLHIIRSLHVVFRLVHHRPGPHILVRITFPPLQHAHTILTLHEKFRPRNQRQRARRPG